MPVFHCWSSKSLSVVFALSGVVPELPCTLPSLFNSMPSLFCSMPALFSLMPSLFCLMPSVMHALMPSVGFPTPHSSSTLVMSTAAHSMTTAVVFTSLLHCTWHPASCCHTPQGLHPCPPPGSSACGSRCALAVLGCTCATVRPQAPLPRTRLSCCISRHRAAFAGASSLPAPGCPSVRLPTPPHDFPSQAITSLASLPVSMSTLVDLPLLTSLIFRSILFRGVLHLDTASLELINSTT
mmetsp:Transcript_101960/g.327186  ORF Transcript_101960/g.327186 Transcript_101960/m.327186 type:complete len:239 (-) Transcript_101960:291-1007(-)